LIGDGALDYSFEGIAEVYYRLALTDQVAFTGDYQFILHPAHNTARGPVNVFGVRAHIAF
jgi:high affinity Mn2+ porin